MLNIEIMLLEGVQKRFTKHVKGLKDTEFEEITQLLNLASLSCRMDKGDTISVDKILHGLQEGIKRRDMFKMVDSPLKERQKLAEARLELKARIAKGERELTIQDLKVVKTQRPYL